MMMKFFLGICIPTNNGTARYFRMYENSSFYKIDDCTIVENYTEDNLSVFKCYTMDMYGDCVNHTYAQFDKDGHQFTINIDWENDIDKLNLTSDVELIKGIIDSTNIKS